MAGRPPLESFLKSPIQKKDLEDEIPALNLWRSLKGKDGKHGNDGINGRDGENGRDGLDGLKGDKGERGLKGEKGDDGLDGRHGSNGKDGEDGRNGSPDTGEDIVSKINKAGVKIEASSIKGFNEIEGLARSANRNVKNIQQYGGPSLLGVSVVGGGVNRVQSITFANSTLTANGDGTNVTITPTGSGGGINIETPSGTVDGTNVTFVVLNTPKYIVVDGVSKFVTLHYTLAGLIITIVDGAPPALYIRSFY